MQLIQEILHRLGKGETDSAGLQYNSLAEMDSSVRRMSAEILHVPYIDTKEEFDRLYVAEFTKQDSEDDAQFQTRISKLNENRFIPAVEIATQKKILFVIDPTRDEIGTFSHLSYGIVSYDAYKQIVGISNDLSLSFDEEEPMPQFIRRLLRYAHEEKANDIDFTSMQATVAIKLKVSGEWTDPIGTFPIAYKNQFFIALCSMALPHPIDYRSGKELGFRIAQNIDGMEMAFRVSLGPQAFGGMLSLRKLPGVGSFPMIDKLGLSEEAIEIMQTLIKRIEAAKKGGLVLITGETGSGKSTLLSAVEGEYLKRRKKVCTSEDPIENKFSHPFLNQTEVGEDAGMTHLDALHLFLRQNADVIVIGESRESDELVAVINAALSGHFAYTTMHTGSNEDTLLRLETMGVNLNMLSGVLKGIISMTLLPKLCPSCKVAIKEGMFVKGDGCPTCKGRGNVGVIPVGEFSLFTDATKRLIGIKKSHEIMDEIKKTKEYISMDSQVKRLQCLGLIDAGVVSV